MNENDAGPWWKLLHDNMGKGPPDGIAVHLVAAGVIAEALYAVQHELHTIAKVMWEDHMSNGAGEAVHLPEPPIDRLLRERISELSGVQARVALQGIAEGHWLDESLDIAETY